MMPLRREERSKVAKSGWFSMAMNMVGTPCRTVHLMIVVMMGTVMVMIMMMIGKTGPKHSEHIHARQRVKKGRRGWRGGGRGGSGAEAEKGRECYFSASTAFRTASGVKLGPG
jgi:hypothetical protein